VDTNALNAKVYSMHNMIPNEDEYGVDMGKPNDALPTLFWFIIMGLIVWICFK
jgi:hypothetical protein